MSHKVRVTMNPEVEIEVGDAELLDLERQGLVLHTKATSESAVRQAAVKQVENKEN